MAASFRKAFYQRKQEQGSKTCSGRENQRLFAVTQIRETGDRSCMDQEIRDRLPKLMADLDEYIKKHWIAEPISERKEVPFIPDQGSDGSKGSTDAHALPSYKNLESLINGVGKTFHEMLFEKIGERHMMDVEVYRRANIDRKLFSKIRNNPAYHPGKNTVLALAIALKLDLPETEELLARAEYAFSPGSKTDVVIRYFIENEIYDIHVINIALYDHGLQPLI